MRWIVAMAVVAACGDNGGIEQSTGRDELKPPGTEAQGRYLLGLHADAFAPGHPDFASVSTAATDANGVMIEVEVVGGGSLSSAGHVGRDPYFDGVTFYPDGGGELQIHTTDRGGTDVAWYQLQFRATPADLWADPCQSDDGVHVDAVPYAGTWSRAGLHTLTPDRISFACEGGVAYKCFGWGYTPDGDATSLAFRANQACTRMARADYCADGQSHTREGTLIQIADVVGVTAPPTIDALAGVKAWPPDPHNFFFEAAWNDGAKPVACLSRLRWQSLPIAGELDGDGAACPNATVPDPRTNAAAFCEDETFSGSTDGPLLFNRSRYSDLAMHIWALGDDHASTVRGYYEPTGLTAPPFPASGLPFEFRATDAMLLRVRRDGLGPLVELHLYSNGTDAYLDDAANPPAGFTDLGFEGFVAKTKPFPNTNLFVPLDVQTNGTDTISTTLSKASYTRVRTLGFTRRAETKAAATE